MLFLFNALLLALFYETCKLLFFKAFLLFLSNFCLGCFSFVFLLLWLGIGFWCILIFFRFTVQYLLLVCSACQLTYGAEVDLMVLNDHVDMLHDVLLVLDFLLIQENDVCRVGSIWVERWDWIFFLRHWN